MHLLATMKSATNSPSWRMCMSPVCWVHHCTRHSCPAPNKASNSTWISSSGDTISVSSVCRHKTITDTVMPCSCGTWLRPTRDSAL